MSAEQGIPQRRGDIPEILSSIGRAVRSVVLVDLPGRTGSWEAPPRAEEWRQQAPFIAAMRLAPLALRALDHDEETACGAPDRLRAYFRAHAFRLQCQTLAVEASVRPLLRHLHLAGIPFAVVKGPAVARFHRIPGDRPFSDVDLLVEPRDFKTVVTAATGCGFMRPDRSRQPWRWFDHTCNEGLNLHSAKSGALDVHHHVSPWIFSHGIPAGDVIARAEPGLVSGVPVRFACLDDCLAVASLHLINDIWKGDPSLLTWRDVAILTDQLGPSRATAVLKERELGWMTALLFSGLEALGIALDDESTSARADMTRGERRMLRRLGLVGWASPTRLVRHPLGWAARLPAPRALAYVAGSVVPSPAYVSTRYGGYWRYWALATSSLRAARVGVDYRGREVASLAPLHGRGLIDDVALLHARESIEKGAEVPECGGSEARRGAVGLVAGNEGGDETSGPRWSGSVTSGRAAPPIN